MQANLKVLTVVFLSAVTWLASPQAIAQSGNAVFQQALTEYQQAPSDAGVAKIIKLAAAMEQKPSIPDEARKYFVRGTALFKDGKTPEDATQAAEEFLHAARIAPWWAEARFNTALAYESAANYANAIANFKTYLLFQRDTPSVQDKIWALEAKAEKSVKDKEMAAQKAEQERRVAAQKAEAERREQQQKDEEAFLKKINGARYIHHFKAISTDGRGREAYHKYYATLDVRGDTMYMGQGMDDGGSDDYFMKGGYTFKIVGREALAYIEKGKRVAASDGIISDDGNSITFANGDVYKRER